MQKKLFSVAILVMAMLLAVVGLSSADVPGGGFYFGSTYQNVGSSDATVQLTAYDSASANTYSYSQGSVAAGESFTVLPGDIPNLPAGFKGSIVASSDQPLAAVVNITNKLNAGLGLGIDGGTASGLYSGVDGSEAATTVNFPLAKNDFFGKTTTFYLQNAGSNAATMSVTFTFNGTDYGYTSPSVSPGQMIAVDPGLAAGAPSGSSAFGSMVVTSAEKIAAVMLEHESTATAATVLQASAGFTNSQLGQTAYCPVVKDSFFGRETGVSAQNAHTVAQDITVTYQPGNIQTVASNVAPGASVNFFQDANLPSGLYSASVSGSAGPVAVVVNESEIPLVNARQTATTYACKASSLATTKLTYPAFKETFFGRATGMQIQNVGGSDATNVVVTFNVGGTTYTTNPQTIAAGASINLLDVRNNAGLWNGAAMPGSSLAGVTVTADQPVIAIINEASWTESGPNNGATSFDKANAVGFNVAP